MTTIDHQPSWSALFWRSSSSRRRGSYSYSASSHGGGPPSSVGGASSSAAGPPDNSSVLSASSYGSFSMVPSPSEGNLRGLDASDLLYDPAQPNSPRVVLRLDVIDEPSKTVISSYPDIQLSERIRLLEKEVLDLREQNHELRSESRSLLQGQQKQILLQRKHIRLLQSREVDLKSRLSLFQQQLSESSLRIKRMVRENSDLAEKLKKVTGGGASNKASSARTRTRNAAAEAGYVCVNCKKFLFAKSSIISTLSSTKHGDASLLTGISNCAYGPIVCRQFPTGLYTVMPLSCTGCISNVGWKFQEAFEERQRYREGKCLVNMSHVKLVAEPPSPTNAPAAGSGGSGGNGSASSPSASASANQNNQNSQNVSLPLPAASVAKSPSKTGADGSRPPLPAGGTSTAGVGARSHSHSRSSSSSMRLSTRRPVSSSASPPGARGGGGGGSHARSSSSSPSSQHQQQQQHRSRSISAATLHSPQVLSTPSTKAQFSLPRATHSQLVAAAAAAGALPHKLKLPSHTPAAAAAGDRPPPAPSNSGGASASVPGRAPAPTTPTPASSSHSRTVTSASASAAG